ncbi:MAG: hypothetical protein ACRC2K_00280 [Clostridium sp.]
MSNNNKNNDQRDKIDTSNQQFGLNEFDELYLGLEDQSAQIGSARRGVTGTFGVIPPGVTGGYDPAQEIENILLRLDRELSALNSAQIAAQSAQIDHSGKIFFDLKVRPFVDTIYFLAFSSSSVANTANVFANNVLSKKRELKHALDLSYALNREIECILVTLRKRMKEYRCGVEKEIGCCNGRCKDCSINKEYDD